MNTVKTICLVFVIVLTLSGCDTGGSESSNKNAPKITDVEIYRWNNVQWVRTSTLYIGDWINYRVYVNDRNQDIVYLYVVYYYPEDSVIPFDSDTIYYNGISAPEVYLTLRDAVQILDGPIGSWRLEIQVEDARGNLSNIWEEYVVLYY